MKEKTNCDICKHIQEEHENNNEEELGKKDIFLYIVSIALFIISFIPALKPYQGYLCTVSVLLSGYKMILEGIKNIFKLNFEEDTLMTIAIIAALILGEFPESCMIILLFKLGEFLEDKAVEKSNDNIKNIVDIQVKTANLIKENNDIKSVNVEDINENDKILIKPGEMVPVDCKVVSGNASLDMSALTGESKPVEVGEGQEILSGSINLNGSITAIVKRNYRNSTASQIADLVYEAKNNKGKTEEFINKFSKIYTPIVIVLALIVGIIPPVVLNQEFKTWIMRALVFLVASCPCSIVISVPLAFFSCIGVNSKKGLLIKGTKHIEALANANYIVLDKTGTITTGKLEIDKIETFEEYSKEEVLKYIYVLEKNSNHPISTAIAQEVEKDNIETDLIVENYEEIPGHGIKATINQKQVLFGNSKLLKNNNIEINNENANFLTIDGKLVGSITFKEEIRNNVSNLFKNLKKLKIKDVIILTGDNKENAEQIAKQIGIKKVYAGLLPKEKQDKVVKLKEDGKVIFIGDGINDSISLAEADFGIAMGEGTEIATTAADGILMSNNINILPFAIKNAKKTMRIIKFNIVFSLMVKLVVVTFGFLGFAPVWLAVIADTGVSLLTVLNSLRILR